jgi:DDE family transposase
VLADVGYRAEATFDTLDTRQITASISLGREGKPGGAPNPAHVATQRMADRLKSDEGGLATGDERPLSNPSSGGSKEVLGFRRFSLRGEAKGRGEWKVVCLAVNLKRLHRIGVA